MINQTASAKSAAQLAEAVRSAAHRVIERCDELAQCSDVPGEIARLFCTPAMKGAHEKLLAWMENAGLVCRMDAAGNFIGRWESNSSGLVCNFKTEHPVAVTGPNESPGGGATGASASTPPAPATLLNQKNHSQAVIIGSHLDSIVNAGKYDGVLGVVMGLALAEIAAETKTELPFALEVFGFSEEEGVRYQTPYIGSLALVGGLTAEILARQDADGISLADALRTFGCNPDRLADAVVPPEAVLVYIEPHIEQGPVLELHKLPVGVVTGIVGQSRAYFEFAGQPGHAGTVPMASRQDALVVAARFIVEVEQFARNRPGLLATVGKIEVLPNVANVIPGEVKLRLDLRHADDEARQAALREITHRAALIAEERDLEFDLLWVQQQSAVQFDAECIEQMEQAIKETGIEPLRMPSGAGHDAAMLAKTFPTAMLFVRCAGGLSHHPDESVAESDVAIALEVLWRFLLKLAAENDG